jgi:phosphoserine phosphatase
MPTGSGGKPPFAVWMDISAVMLPDQDSWRLVLVSRTGEEATRLLAEAAPGGQGQVSVLGKSPLVVLERRIDPAARAELLAWLPDRASTARVDWALTPSTNRRKRLLISDMDSTIIGQECLDELADFAGLKAEVSAITERAMRGELDFESALTTRVAMLKGLALTALERCHDERVRLNPGARALTATMTAHGARCVLVSGGFRFFTSRVAAAAGFHADRANVLLDDGASLTGEVARPILGREAKLAALQQEASALGLRAEDALALGDGANDLDMIRAAGLGVSYRAKPIVAAETTARIDHTDLTAALFFQGYRQEEIIAL